MPTVYNKLHDIFYAMMCTVNMLKKCAEISSICFCYAYAANMYKIPFISHICESYACNIQTISQDIHYMQVICRNIHTICAYMQGICRPK